MNLNCIDKIVMNDNLCYIIYYSYRRQFAESLLLIAIIFVHFMKEIVKNAL